MRLIFALFLLTSPIESAQAQVPADEALKRDQYAAFDCISGEIQTNYFRGTKPDAAIVDLAISNCEAAIFQMERHLRNRNLSDAAVGKMRGIMRKLAEDVLANSQKSGR